ncbi:MAG: pyridoxal-phosphate dependent enzyme [Aureispira sp.]|nr:pyridoxal-phosphate dependent enzyme [Aureispira sp.]
MDKLHIETPIFESYTLNNKLGKRIFFKMDCFQPSGSFKIRGIGNLCQTQAALGAKHFVAASGGNAGCAAAYAGRQLGVPTTVVVPETTSVAMQERIAAIGATVKVFGKVWDDSDVYARSLAKKDGAVYIPPFDSPSIWEGNASIIDEANNNMHEPDAVIVSVGGGGLLCGVMEGLERNDWKNATVFTTETKGAASYAAAVEAKELVRLDAIASIASSLGAKQVCSAALDWSFQRDIQPLIVSDVATLEACQWFLDEFGILVEPACGAALSAVYHEHESIANAQTVLVVVCGGRGMTLDKFNNYCEQLL